jgi:CxxC-x17-CxxC domain-containing protein
MAAKHDDERKAGRGTPAGEQPPRRNTRQKRAPEVLKPKVVKPAAGAPPERERPRAGREEGRGRAGRPSRGGARDARQPANEGPRFVGGPRNEFGTRIARRVTCARCGTSDHVPFVPKDPSKALCRSCAAEVLKTYEAGVRVRTPTRMTTCNLCGTPFDLPITAEDDGDPLCPSCLRGFTAWQGSVDVPFAERKQAVVEERLSGALVRKRKKEG